MLVLCYAVLVSSAFAAPRVSRTCYDYCKTKISDPIKDASLECDCVDFIETVIESDESSMIILDDTGVYFVPAETDSFQGQYSTRPFFISNPAKLIPKTKNRIDREYVTLKEPLNDPVPSQTAHVEIYKRTKTISHTSINEDLGKPPLYLDIETQESTDKDRAAVQQYTLIEDFESTERDLVECLDFQVVHYTRKYGLIEKFREFWTTRNLDKYEHLSDLVIEENIQKWCSKPDSIVQHSLQDIKQGLPRIGHYRPQKIDNKNQLSDPQNSATSVTTLYNNVTKQSVTDNENAEGYTLTQNISEIYDTTYDPVEDWPFVSVTLPPTLEVGSINEIQNRSSPEEAVSDTTEITTKNTLLNDNLGETTIEANQPVGVTASDSEKDLDTMASEDVFYSYVPTVTEVKILDDARNLGMNTSILDNPTTPSNTEEYLEKQSTVNNVNILDGQTLMENNTLSYDTSQISVTELYPEFREKYEEKDIRIPKIITKECQNNTIQTTIDGFEELPKSDFKDSTSQSENFEKGYGDSALDITGRLYFVSKRQLVPVRFVQTDTGAISLGVDGPTLCDKLVNNTNKKSQLLTVLCEYIQNKNNMYQNKNSSLITN